MTDLERKLQHESGYADRPEMVVPPVGEIRKKQEESFEKDSEAVLDYNRPFPKKGEIPIFKEPVPGERAASAEAEKIAKKILDGDFEGIKHDPQASPADVADALFSSMNFEDQEK